MPEGKILVWQFFHNEGSEPDHYTLPSYAIDQTNRIRHTEIRKVA